MYLIHDTKNDKTDVKGKNAPSLVAKVHPSNELFEKEIQTMQSISEASSKAADSKKTPQVVDHGKFLLVDSTLIDL